MSSEIIGITGSSGVLGKELIKKFKGFKIQKFNKDICSKKDIENWLEKHNISSIIHLAAVVPTEYVNKNKAYAKKVNYYGTKNLVDSISKIYKKKIWFFYSSTSHVYNFSNKKISEQSRIKPISYYGYTKLYGEKYLKLRKNNINFCIGRIFSFSSGNQKKMFFIPSSINKLKRKKKIIKFGNLKHERDFIHISDIVSAIIKLHKLKKTGIYNICSSKTITLIDIVKELNKIYKKKILFDNSFNKTKLIGDNKKLKKIGWKIKKNFLKNLNYDHTKRFI